MGSEPSIENGSEESGGMYSRRASIAASLLDSPLQPPSLSKIPSSMSSWEPPSATEKQKPFKSKSKHNLAIFGAKLTSTAASVGVHTSKYKQQRDLKEQSKDAHRESVFVDTPDFHPFDPSAIIGSPAAVTSAGTGHNGNDTTRSGVGNNSASGGSSNGGSSGLKSKMFKQSKTDLKSLKIKTDLSIQAARSSFNDMSPMSRGGSTRELDRIAAIGQQANSPLSGEFPFGHDQKSHYHLHHHHLSFRKRDSPAAVLSSSASNSTLASEGTVYTFNQPNSITPVATSGISAQHSFKTPEEASAFLTSSWALLNQRIQPVFKREEALRIPVEDVNILVFMHFTAHHEQGGTGIELLNRVDELLHTGIRSSSILPHEPSLSSLAESWQYFYTKTLIALEAIFLPLQLELDGMGQIFTNARSSSEYWMPLIGHRSSAFNKNNASIRKLQKPNIRKRVLTVYRDLAIVPILPQINVQLNEWRQVTVANPEVIPDSETISQMLQCFTALSNSTPPGDALTEIGNTLELLTKNTSKQMRSALQDPNRR